MSRKEKKQKEKFPLFEHQIDLFAPVLNILEILPFDAAMLRNVQNS